MSPGDSKPLASKPSRRVLIVDDCIDNAEMMSEAVSYFGYEPAIAQDAATALGLMQHFKADAVLLDIELPGMDGIELGRQLRAEHGPELNIVVISGYALARYRSDAAAAGIQHYLLKPVELGRLEDLLKSIFSGAERGG